MAKFKVEGPGGKIFSIEGPDDASEDEILSFAESEFAKSQPASKPDNQPAPYTSTLDWIDDLVRNTVNQGVLLGYGDELGAAVTSLYSDKSYDEILKNEREARDRFRYHNPVTSLGAEVAGGFAVPASGAARAIGAASTIPGKIYQGAKYGAGYGSVAGFGATDAGDGNIADQTMERIGGAVEGAKWGAGFGAAIPAAATALRPVAKNIGASIGRATQTVRDNEAGARLYYADRLRQAGMTEADVARDLARGQDAAQFSKTKQAELPEMIADTANVNQRILRGIKVGGDADDQIVPALSDRQAGDIDFSRGGSTGGQFQRIYNQLRTALDVSKTPLRTEIDRLTDKRAITANKAFRDARNNSEPFDLERIIQVYRLEAQNLPDPKQRSILLDVLSMFEPDPMARGAFGSRANDMSTRFGTNNVDRFDQARRALGDLMSTKSIREQGNLKRLLTRFINDAKDEVAGGSRSAPTRNAGYFEALQDFATRSELIDAADIGRAVADGAEDMTSELWKTFSRAEQKIIRKAYLEKLRSKSGSKTVGESTDFTDQLRKPNVQNALRIMLPPQAGKNAAFPGGNRERLGELVSREWRMTQTNQKVLGNSSTAEKAVDATDIGRMARVARYIRENGGPVQAAVSAVSEALERFGAIKGQRARYLAQKLLSTDPQEQAEFLRQVTATYGASRAARIARALEETASSISRATLPVSNTVARFAAEND